MMFVRTFPLGVLALFCLVVGQRVAGLEAALPGHFLAFALMLWLTPGALYTLLGHYQPGLLRERMRPPSDRDRATRLASTGLFLLALGCAGHEFGARGGARWTSAVELLGFALCLTGFALTAWTFFVNPYASSAVRIQRERDHRLVTSGPYALVRHPMYLGVLAFAAGAPLALGSLWAFVPMLVVVVLFARRTLVEDAMLQAELPGYRAYAARVRWRVVPLVF